MNDSPLLPCAVSLEGEANLRKGGDGVKTTWIFFLPGEISSKLYGVYMDVQLDWFLFSFFFV